ncbi:MAG: TolC family protein [Gemmatimonadales bacterium]|nr:TolC family protein [Gemmatimonadales bacterium]
MTRSIPLRLAVIIALIPAGIGAQAPLSLREALGRAAVSAYSNRVAEADYRAAGARSALANQGILPTVRADVGAIHTNDPLAGFGFLLRQRSATTAAFDPEGLNNPDPRTDVGSVLTAELPLINLDAWAARRAAGHAQRAEGFRRDWSATAVQLDVLTGYYGAVLARERADVLRASEMAAQAHLRRAESVYRNGLVTRSDVLLAEVRLGEIETQRIAAEADEIIARQRLAVILGTPGDTAFTLPQVIPVVVMPVVDTAVQGERADVAMVAAQVDAAEADVRRRTLTLLPRINGFSRLEWHDSQTPFTGRSMATVGIMATWSPFSGGSELAARKEALAASDAARAGLEATEAMAALQLASAQSAFRVASHASTIAARSVAQASEAHRIVQRKYEGGLATVAELLDAQATEMSARLAEAKARHDLVLARGTLARVQAEDLDPLAAALDAMTVWKEQE